MNSRTSVPASLQRPCRNHIAIILFDAVLTLSLGVITPARSYSQSPSPTDSQLAERHYSKGVPIPSQAQQEKVSRLPKIVHVRLNAAGLRRVNEARLRRGETMLHEPDVPVADFGREITVLPVSSNVPSFSPEPTSAAAPQLLETQTSGSADNSALDSFPPIRDQDSQGSCAAFSTTYYQMTHMTALARGWNAKTGGDAVRFSPKWTYNMMNGGSDNGTFIDENLSMLRDHGCATWAEFPYTGYSYDYLAWCMTPSVWSNALSFRMNDYSTITGLYDATNLALLKSVLDNGYVVTFDSYSPWSYQGWVRGTVGNDPGTSNDNAYAGQAICKYVRALDWGHAMTIVGYNDDIWCDLNGNGVVDSGEKGALKIANSWGTSWGNNGFAWFAYDALKTDSAVSGWNPSDKVYGFGYNDRADNCVAYVITPRTQYTPRFMARFTINHAQRGQIKMSLGKDTASVTNNPSSTWTTAGLNNCGGSFAFNGTSSTCDGTFYLDLTDLASDPCKLHRYFVGMTSSSGTGQLKSYTLLDTVTGDSLTVTPSNAPPAMNPRTGIVNTGTAWGWMDMGIAAAGPSNCSAAATVAVTIRDNSSASPYPVTLTVTNLPEHPQKVTVSLLGLTHTYPGDINVLLVSPAGQRIILMTDSGGEYLINNINLTFDDTANSTLPTSTAIQSSSYRPTDNNAKYTLTAPAPARPYGTSLSVLTNTSPNGIWNLYITDSAGGDVGSLNEGWSLTFSYSAPPSPWLAWQTNSFTPMQLANPSIPNPMCDPDQDGYCNLVEYAFNSNPSSSLSTPSRISVHMERVSGVLTPVFSYPRRAGVSDITYTEEVSTNLVTWAADQTTFLQATSDTNGITETVETLPNLAPIPPGPTFFRIRVSR